MPPKRLYTTQGGKEAGRSLKARTEAHGHQWKESAACRGMDTDLFFPTRGHHSKDRDWVTDICKGCPVRWECLYEGLTNKGRGGRLEYGIWGGFGQDERDGLLGLTRRQAALDRARRALQREPKLVSFMARYRRGDLPWQGQPPEGPAA